MFSTRWIRFLLPFAAMAAYAQDDKIAALEGAVKSAQSAGDNAWMLVSAALGPDDDRTWSGLVLWRAGSQKERARYDDAELHSDGHRHRPLGDLWLQSGVRRRHAFIGDLRYLFLNGVGAEPNADYAGTIPQQTFMVYQLMFAIITPALITGAFAERMRFSAMVLFMCSGLFIVYFPMAHMVWGKGGLLNAFLGGSIPCFDFAGGTVVHITSGFSALVCALYLGQAHRVRRRGHEAA